MLSTQYFSPIVTQHMLAIQAPEQRSYTWTLPSLQPFNELLISWNALRPSKGHYVILASVLHRKWSPWLLYAVWGSREQYSFHDTTPHAPVHTFQDQVELLDGQQATGFRIRVEACGGADLHQFSCLFACTSQLNAPKTHFSPPETSIELPVKGISQLCLQHPRATSFCSPTSATSVIQSLMNSSTLHPMDFAKSVYDSSFDIYGNWPFNTAQIYVELGTKWRSFCARLADFNSILTLINQGYPVITSIKGPLTGSLKPYASGHLLVVRGYDAEAQRVLCMDPAYLVDEQTFATYPLHEFMTAWASRHNLAYLTLKTG